MTIDSLRPSMLLGLFVLAASGCDPASDSLGDEPEGSSGVDDSGSGATGDDTAAVGDAQRLSRLEGVSIDQFAARPDGSVVAIGRAGYGGTSGDLGIFEGVWIGAFGLDGELAWQNVTPFETVDGEIVESQFTSIAAAEDGAVFVSFVDYTASSDNNRVIKFDPQGAMLWETSFSERTGDLAPMPDGGVVAVGSVSAEGENDTTYGWATKLDADGSAVVARTWFNEGGRSTRLAAAATGDEGRILVGGSWGNTQANYLGQAWLAWLDQDLETVAEVRLPDDGEFGRIETVRIDDAGHGLAYGTVGSFSNVSISPQAEVLSVTPTAAGSSGWSSPYGANAYLGVVSGACDSGDQFDPIPCTGTVLQAIEDGAVQWQSSFGGCGVTAAHTLDGEEAFVTVRCDSDAAGAFGLAGELWRVTAP